MAWTDPRDWTTGEVVTAAIMNAHVRDNLNVTSAGVVTTAGDIAYASAAHTMARVGKGTNGNIIHQASCAPAWTASPSITGITLSGDLTVSGGCVILTGAATDIDLIDNNASALSFDASGKTGIIDIVTTNGSEGVTMSGTLGVTGVLTATGGLAGGAICIGASTITTTGLISGGSLDIDNVLINGTTIGHTCDTDLLTVGNAALTVKGTVTVGVDDTGHDVKLFGAAAGAFMLWDEGSNLLDVRGATAAGPGHLKLTTGELTVVACDVLGRIDFQAPLEADCSADARLVGATIAAVAQGTFGNAVNATDLLFYTGHSETAAEKIRFTSQNEIGIAGANYGTDGQVLTSGGAGAAVAWEDAAGARSVSGTTDNGIVTFVNSGSTFAAEANLKFDGTTLTTAGQIAFPATQSASADANTLDDYEEGTWSPVIADSGDLCNTATMHGTTAYGQYTKIGHRVFVTVYAATTSVSGISAGLVMKGLPFTVKSGAQYYGSIDFGHGSGLNIGGEVPSGYFEPNTSVITLREWDGADGTTNLTAAEWSDDGSIMGMGHYIT